MTRYYTSSLSYPIKERNAPQIVILVNNKIADIEKKTVYNSNISYSEYSNPSHTPKYPKSELKHFRNELEKISSLNDVLVLSEPFFSNSKFYLFERIRDLFDLFDEDEDSKISIDSLKSMLTFLFLIDNFIKPRITLNENGTFQTNWKKDNFNLITLRFKEVESSDYVIFKSSKYSKKPIILNGNMSIFDFRDYLIDLGLYNEISER